MRSPLLFALALGASGLCFADVPRVPAKRISTPPVIDGVLNDAEWSAAAAFEGLKYVTDGSPAGERSQFWLSYDDEFVYFAARLHDPQPGSIRAVEYRTNVNMPGDDRVVVAFDLSGSLADFNEFSINPRGATNVELAGGRAAKREWTGEFVAKSRITAEGWETEARIPWQIMRIPAQGKRDVRFNVARFLARTSRGAQFGVTNNGQTMNTPFWTDVELPKPVVDRSIKLLPFVYAGFDDREKNRLVLNSGLDLKTQLTDQITAVGTINPDFRNIENSILSLDFSRFERIADETRPFFLEGSQYTGSGLFASQRIGSFDMGLNIYGKLNDKVQLGVVDTIDFKNQNAFLTNLTYDPSPQWSYRATVTSLTEPGYSNNAYLLRASRNFGGLSASLRTLGSSDTNLGFGAQHDFNIEYAKQSTFAWAGYEYVEPKFDPALGFFPDRDYKGFNFGFARSPQFKHGPVQRHGYQAFGSKYTRLNGEPYRDNLNLDTFLVFRNQFFTAVNADFSTFEGSKDHVYSITGGYPNNDPYRAQNIRVSKGRIQDTDYTLVSYDGNFRPFRGLQITASHQLFELGQRVEQSIVGISYDLGKDRSIAGRAVRFEDDLNWYLAFRQSGNRGIEYFVILGDPNARKFRESLILKVVLPFEIGGKRHATAGGEKHALSG